MADENVRHCDRCKKPLTAENSADGVNGFEIRYAVPEAPEKTKAEEACNDCYADFRAGKK